MSLKMRGCDITEVIFLQIILLFFQNYREDDNLCCSPLSNSSCRRRNGVHDIGRGKADRRDDGTHDKRITAGVKRVVTRLKKADVGRARISTSEIFFSLFLHARVDKGWHSQNEIACFRWHFNKS